MKKENLFENIALLKQKFCGFFQHRKKITALENFSCDTKFTHKNYLNLVKECLTEGFLGEDESKFLDFMLNKYEVNYLDWAHKTKWLKDQIAEKADEKPKAAAQQLFDFERARVPVHVPLEILNNKNPQIGRRL